MYGQPHVSYERATFLRISRTIFFLGINVSQNNILKSPKYAAELSYLIINLKLFHDLSHQESESIVDQDMLRVLDVEV